MGTALLMGIIKATSSTKAFTHSIHFHLSASSDRSIQRLKDTFNHDSEHVNLITKNSIEAARSAEVIILAYQPNQLSQVFEQSELIDAVRGKLTISVLAGVSTSQIAEVIYKDATAKDTRITRVIPTIGAQISESVTLLAQTALSNKDHDTVASLFRLIGTIHTLPESQIATATGISAATHALTLIAVDSIVDASVASGIPRRVAIGLATQCLRSSASYLGSEDQSLEGFKEAMSVERGTTINAILRFEKEGLRAGVAEGVRGAVGYAERVESKLKIERCEENARSVGSG